MEEENASRQGNWGVWLIEELVHPFTIVATPAFLFLLMAYLVFMSFQDGFAAGIRSFSGVLLPLVILTFIFIFQRELLEQLGRISALRSFAIAFLIGLIVMFVIRLLAGSSGIPVTEFVLSASFSTLVFSYASLRGNKTLSYYYGMISGFLIYIIVLGFPVLSQ